MRLGQSRGRHVLAALGALVAAGILAAPAVAGSDTGLVGQWSFDELGGQSALDAGPYRLDGQLGATAEPDPADPARVGGASGGALRFAGDSVVRLPDASELAVETLTVEAVVRAGSSPGRFRYVVSRGSHGCVAGSYGLYTGSAGGMAIYVFDGSRYVVSPIARPSDVWDGAWHHVAGTFDGRVLRLFVDGRPVGEPLEWPLRIDYSMTTSSAAFGRYVGDCDLSFRGDLDLVRLWSVPLSPQAVADAAPRALEPGRLPPLSDVTPLPAAAPAAVLPAGPVAGTPPSAAPGAPARACALRLSRTRIAVRRRTAVRVRVTLRGKPVRAVRVVAERRGRSRPITAARTGAAGRVRLVIRVGRPGRVRVSAVLRPGCRPGYIHVARAR